MTPAEVISNAHKNTGSRASQIGIDADFLLLASLQEMCGEMRWPWRKKTTTFSSVASTGTVDLTDSSGANITDLEEIISIHRIDSTTSIVPLDVLETDDEIVGAITDTTTGDPTAYCKEPGSAEATIRLSPVPNAVKTYRILYWAIPSVLDSSANSIPLLPPRWHYILVKRLESKFLAALPNGQGTADAQLKAGEYLHGLELMKAKTKFSTKEPRVWVSREEAIRSR